MKEELIKKWLNGELTPEELEAFKQLDEYTSYAKLSDKAKLFKAPDFDEKASLNQLEFEISSQTKPSKHSSFKYVIAIAAVLVISFLIFKNFNSDLNLIETSVAKTETLTLPDQSKVNLNANSKLSYNSLEWDSNRQLTLEGEAFFEVEKGKTFTVKTNYGEVEVLGTVFNVKSRDYAFEVICFEGSVQVSLDGKTYIVEADNRLVLENNAVKINFIDLMRPDWKENQTIIKSQPLKVVLQEFKNYYDVEFEVSNVDTSKIYTGTFSHNDLEIALKSITLPLGLSYSISDKKIILSNQ